jgi:hypothetical protein
MDILHKTTLVQFLVTILNSSTNFMIEIIRGMSMNVSVNSFTHWLSEKIPNFGMSRIYLILRNNIPVRSIISIIAIKCVIF